MLSASPRRRDVPAEGLVRCHDKPGPRFVASRAGPLLSGPDR
jgi:hypothetical protein